MLRIGRAIDVFGFELLVDRILFANLHDGEDLAGLAVRQRHFLAGVDAGGNIPGRGERDRDRPEDAISELHVHARAAPVVMSHEAAERRIGAHGQHENVGDRARIERDFFQSLRAVAFLRTLALRQQQRLDLIRKVRRHELRHGSLRPLWGLVLGFLLERFPDGFVTNKSLFVWLFLTRRQKACVAVRNFGDWFLLAHKSPFCIETGLSFKQVA